MGSRIDREALDRNVIVLLRWKNIRIRVNNIVLPLFQNVTRTILKLDPLLASLPRQR
jgi:hypothetical protein